MKIRIKDLQLYEMPVDEMAYARPRMAAKLVGKTNDIVRWWGFLYYLTHCGDPNGLLNHEKGKLAELLNELRADQLKSGNSSRIKRGMLLAHWGKGTSDMPGRELLTDEPSVAAIVSAELYKERIFLEEAVLSEVCQAFMVAAPKLIDLICDGTPQQVYEYLDGEFPSTVVPQKKRRRK